MDVALRIAAPADDAFLRRLHATAHCGALLSMSLGPDALEALLGLQYDTQRAQYRARHPDALDEIVVADGDAVGRCWTGRSSRELRLLDIAVIPDRQRTGVAGTVLDLLLERARDARIPLRLSVWSENAPALALYRGHGLHETMSGAEAAPCTTGVGYRELEWSPTPARTS